MLNDDGNDGTMLRLSYRSLTIYPTDMACGLASGSLRHVSKSFTNERRDFLIAPSISSTINSEIRFSDDRNELIVTVSCLHGPHVSLETHDIKAIAPCITPSNLDHKYGYILSS